jgi:cyclic pyranopterin phosphate synthase
MSVADRLGRPLRNLRLSVVDRCNLRCTYCMPEADYTWLPKHDILSFEEIDRLVDVFLALGVDKLRLTGGEPLVRRDLPVLVAMLARKPGLHDLALTTNGVLLAEHAGALRAAGLHRITVSLDTLRRERFVTLAQRDLLAATLAGIAAAAEAGFTALKLDTVVLRGVNDDEIVDLVRFAQRHAAEIRFIEYMDVGGATRWSPEAVYSRAAILATVEAALGPAEPLPGRGAAPAERFRLADGSTFGIIASTTQPFCAACDRSRLTADGMWYHCLYAQAGTDLRAPLRAGASSAELADRIATGWRARADRGAEERARLDGRAPLLAAEDLRGRPHLEMHTRGG